MDMCDARLVSGFLRVLSGGGKFVPEAHCAANMLRSSETETWRFLMSKGVDGQVLATLEHLPPIHASLAGA